MTRFGEIGPALKSAGWDIIPIKPRTKVPGESNWQHGFSLERVQAFAANGYAGGNTGLLAKNFPGVDIDVADPTVARALVDLALHVLGPAPVRVGAAPKCLLMYSTPAPFSKMKVFLSAPDGSTKGPDGKDYAVEILGDGQQYLIYGEHPDGFQYRWPRGGDPLNCEVWDITPITREQAQAFLDAIPSALPQGWTVRESSAGAQVSNQGGDLAAFEAFKAPLDGWDLARVEAEILPHLDPSCGYDEWLSLGAAMHHQGEGDVEWLQAWDAWSAGSDKYAEGLCQRKWDSFTANRAAGSVTLASWISKTKDARAAAAAAATIDAAATHRSAIEAAPDEAAVRDVAQRIALDGSLDRLARDMLAGALQARLRQLTGVKPSIQAVRALVTMSRGRAPTQAAGGPSWIEPWCYVTAQARFFNRVTKEVLTREAFDAAHTRHMPLNAEGQRPSAAKVACEEWGLPTVYNLMYLPSAGDMFNMDGLEYANLYRPDSVPTAVIDAAANAVLMRHVELLIPEPVYREIFLQFAAWVVRNPGHKVLWALLIKGVEGDGKSVLGSMIAQAMGHENVGIISPETLAGSNFNDWAVGRCVNVLEELKMQGHNRHDVYNKIKPLITNPRIEVHGKGKASMTAVNTTNYIGFTNHDDALPLDDMDRRHFVLFTPWRAIGEMHAAVAALGLTMDQYWEQLWDVVKNRPDVVRGFFEAVDLAGFNPNSRAPATVFKQAVVAAGDLDDAEGFARFWIEEGCHGVSSQIVSSACLTKALADMDPPVQIHTTRVRKLLKSMGFEQVPGFLKWKGAAHRVWVRVTGPGVTSLGVGASTAELRAALDKTTGSVVEDFLQ